MQKTLIHRFSIKLQFCGKPAELASFSLLLILLDVMTMTDLVGSMQECGTMLALSTMEENTSSISGTTPATAAPAARNRGISSF